jgi:multidrug efflux pump subunit AcrB
LNTAYSNSATVGPGDADIQVSLAEKHHPTEAYVDELRTKLAARFPGTTFYELPVDMVTQILNFGAPAPIDIQIVGPNLLANRDFAEQVLNRIKFVAGAIDLRIQQPFNNPRLFVDVDRTKAAQLGMQQKDVTNSLLTATSGSFQTAPSFFLDPKNNVSYNIAVQSPQYDLDTLQDLANIPITPASGGSATGSSDPPAPNGLASLMPSTPLMSTPTAQILGNVASFTTGAEMATVTHYNIASAIDIYGNVGHSDLKTVSDNIETILAQMKDQLPHGSQMVVRGQVQTMHSSFIGLYAGLAFSIVLVYLLIVVNFQSWLDPFIIISGLPAALSGIVWFLFLTHTRISVPALTGAIMCMGVATSNSILVISFARERLEENVGEARTSAIEAGSTRFRPVIMTALAMIIGMIPMALGLGDGGEQNAPLGRAVIGGLLFGTVSTLFFVPTFFSVLHSRLARKRDDKQAKQARADQEKKANRMENAPA